MAHKLSVVSKSSNMMGTSQMTNTRMTLDKSITRSRQNKESIFSSKIGLLTPNNATNSSMNTKSIISGIEYQFTDNQ